MDRMTIVRRSPVAMRIALAVVTVAFGGCARDAGGGAGGPYAKEVNAAIPGIEKAIGLTFKSPPKVERRSKDEVREFLTRTFNESMPADELSGIERSYKRLGLVPDTLALRAFMLELLTEQVVGYYDPATKVLYIVDGAAPEMVGVTVSHELVHALQDQYISLDSIQKTRADNDRQVAAQAVIEGQATFEQVQSMIGSNNLAAVLPGGWERVRDMIREQQGAMPVFSSAPLIIQETLIFPYLSGAEFMKRFEERQPGKVPFGDMPLSTEQILHAESYFDRRDAPSRLTLPELASGHRLIYANNLGEFETRLYLFQHLQDQNAAIRGAAGWDGDRFVLFETRGGDGIAWLTVWDSSVDAAEFNDLMDTAISRRFRNAKPREATTTARTYEGEGRTLRLSTAEVNGRPVVLFVDVPTGAPIDAIDLSKVVIEQQ